MKKGSCGKIAKKLCSEKSQFGKYSFVEFLMSKTKSFQRFQEMSTFVTSILKASNYPFFVVDTEFNIQYMNPACMEFSGIGFKEMAGQSCLEVFKSDLCRSACAIQQAMTTRKPVVGKWVKVIDRNGNEHQIVVNAGALIDAGGNVLGGFEMWRDALPDTEAAMKISALLTTLNHYSGDMNKLIDKLKMALPAPMANTIRIRALFEEMKKKNGNLIQSCDELLHAYCWSIKNCPPERQVQCPAFPNNGRNCWEVDYTWCDGQMQGKAKEKADECSNCKVRQDFTAN